MSNISLSANPGVVASPCIDVCQVDDQGYCLGCSRTLDEIARWPTMTPLEQQLLLADLVRRRSEI